MRMPLVLGWLTPKLTRHMFSNGLKAFITVDTIFSWNGQNMFKLKLSFLSANIYVGQCHQLRPPIFCQKSTWDPTLTCFVWFDRRSGVKPQNVCATFSNLDMMQFSILHDILRKIYHVPSSNQTWEIPKLRGFRERVTFPSHVSPVLPQVTCYIQRDAAGRLFLRPAAAAEPSERSSSEDENSEDDEEWQPPLKSSLVACIEVPFSSIFKWNRIFLLGGMLIDVLFLGLKASWTTWMFGGFWMVDGSMLFKSCGFPIG